MLWELLWWRIYNKGSLAAAHWHGEWRPSPFCVNVTRSHLLTRAGPTDKTYYYYCGHLDLLKYVGLSLFMNVSESYFHTRSNGHLWCSSG